MASQLISAVLFASIIGTGCKGSKQEPAPTPSVVTPGDAAAPVPPPDAPDAVDAAVASHPAPGPKDLWRGPFASTDAYCDEVFGGLAAENCAEDPTDVPADPRSGMCSCGEATSDNTEGPVAVKKNANDVVLSAAILKVARNSRDFVSCELAIETDQGIYVVPSAFACDLAPVAHDGEAHVMIKSLTISETKNGANIELSWVSSLEKAKRGRVSCTYRSPGPPVCSRP